MEVLNQESTEGTTKDSLSKDKDQFVTVVSVGTEKNYENIIFDNISPENNSQNGFVTVLTIGDELPIETFSGNEFVEEVLVYRLPGERLGFGLKFEGGTKTTECVRRLFIQSCASDSPASRVKCSWGNLAEGDEIVQIDSYSVKTMTRIDCVRCLKDSNVVIKLLVRHSQHINEDFTSDPSRPINSDEEFSSEELSEKIKSPPPPPPIPPRKLSRKMLKDKNGPSNGSQTSIDTVDEDAQILPISPKVKYPISASRAPKVPSRDRKLSHVSSGPPDAEVYLDLLAQELEYGIKTESESDDTGSTISTVIDKHNSIFLTSNPSSIASDSIPSTPTAIQKHLDLSKVVNPFEMLEMEYAANIQPNDDFLFTRFVSSHDILRENEQTNNLDNRISDCEKTSLTPPANFQDAPLSYGNEDVSTITYHDNAATNGIIEPKETNHDDAEEFEHRIVEKIKVPKPVPRKCYTKKKVEPEEILESLGPIEDVDDAADTLDFNLPRLVNFVPKILPKSTVSEMRYSLSDPDLQMRREDTEYHNLCLMKYNHHSDDFNYLYPNSSDYIECNNNECDKIISCSSWSLHNQLATIGESEEEMDSLENSKARYDDEDSFATITKTIGDKNLSDREEDNVYPILSVTNSSDNGDMEEPLHYASDKRILINHSAHENIISLQENIAMISENETANQENEIPAIHLVQNGDESSKEDKKEIDATSNTNIDISETMAVSNFIQSEQQHAITTSEYSSLSSLSSPPLSFSSRLPPDGQEFPSTCQETVTLTRSDTLGGNTKCDPLPACQMKSVGTNSSSSSTPSWVKNISEPLATTTTRSSLWRKDQSSAGSVKHKIAIFNSGENSEPLLPLTKTYKSSENISVDKTDMYSKKNKISKSCLSVNNIPSMPKENNYQVEKNDNQKENKKEDTFEFTKPSLNYASSFSTKPATRLHSRSQSLLDMSSLDAPWNNPDNRRLTLNTLIEQRRRGLSKLRGLVIPQTDVPVAEPIMDLPEIRSKESTLVNQVTTNRSKSEILESPTLGHQRSNSTSLQSPSWKNNSISNLPRYSPAFKRKCLQVYVMEQSSSGPISNNNCSPKTPDSVFHSDYDTNASLTSNSLNSISNDDVFTKKVESTKSIENITSPSNSEISFEYSYQSTNSNNSIDVQNDNNYYAKKSCPVPKIKNDPGRSEEVSDNDSAVSSSQSSYISRECSPLPSPLQDYSNNPHLVPALDANTLPKSKDLYTVQGKNLSSRVLKPQSVEAINRKNILASAKCRSGRDFKNGSPLIQRKLNGSDEEKLVDEQKPEETELSNDTEKVSVVESNGNNEEDDTDKQSTASSTESISTESIKSKESDIQPEIKECDINIISAEENIPKYPIPEIKAVVQQPAPVNEIEKLVLRNTSKLNTSNVQLRHSTPLPATRKYSFDALERPSSIQIPIISRYDANRRASVTDIRKQFEKFEKENQKSPVFPEPKSPAPRSFTKNPVTKTQAAKSPVESKVFSSNVFKENKTTPKNVVYVKPVSDITANITPEELEQTIKEVNEGIDINSDLYVNQNEVIIVVLQREVAGGSIGITLTGGTDYEAKEITVHKVLTGSCAHKDGRLKKGDRILSINGKKMLGLTHKESIDILKDPKPEVSLLVLPYKGKITQVTTSIRKASSEVSIAEESTESPQLLDTPASKESLIKVELIKDGAGLGFSLDGGRDSPKGDKPLIIKKIFTGGSAEKCDKLQAGDELIEVNEVDVFKMTRIEVWSMMKKLPDGKVSLTIRR